MKLNDIFLGLILIKVVSIPVYSLYKTKKSVSIAVITTVEKVFLL